MLSKEIVLRVLKVKNHNRLFLKEVMRKQEINSINENSSAILTIR